MLLRSTLLFILCSVIGQTLAQSDSHRVQYVDVNVSLAKRQGGLSLGYVFDWQLGRNKKIEIGLGAHFTSYSGINKYYITAPAELTSGVTNPSALFKENIAINIDTFFIKHPQVNMLNLVIDLGYKLNQHLKIGFNIDFIGVSFGAKQQGNFISLSSNVEQTDSSLPTTLNLLLISDNDLGSLNSEFYAKYFLQDRWGIKAGTQFLFTEYTTNTNVQKVPALNDRFRLKSLMLSVGVSRVLN